MVDVEIKGLVYIIVTSVSLSITLIFYIQKIVRESRALSENNKDAIHNINIRISENTHKINTHDKILNDHIGQREYIHAEIHEIKRTLVKINSDIGYLLER